MNTTIEIKGKVRQYVEENSYAEEDAEILDSSLLFEEGIFDSMGFVTLLSFIEESFDITPQDADLIEENFESIDAITGYIQRKKQTE